LQIANDNQYICETLFADGCENFAAVKANSPLKFSTKVTFEKRELTINA